MDNEYINKVKKWVELDNNILRSQETIKPHLEAIGKNKEELQTILDEKKNIEDEIVQYIEKNKYDKLTVNITDGIIKFGKKTAQQPVTLKILKHLLDRYSEENNTDLTELFEFITENLDKKTSYFMKREIK